MKYIQVTVIFEFDIQELLDTGGMKIKWFDGKDRYVSSRTVQFIEKDQIQAVNSVLTLCTFNEIEEVFIRNKEE